MIFFPDLTSILVENMASRAAQMFNTIKPHVPLIKFRKGAGLAASIESPLSFAPVSQPVVQPEPAHVASSPSGPLKSAAQTHEWWDTPFKYKKRQIDQLEMDIINSGGSDKLYC